MKSHAIPVLAVLMGALGCSPGGPAPGGAGPTTLAARNPHGNYMIPGVLGDVVYHRAGGVELALDAYAQKRGENRPAVIVVHGGGWTSGSRIARVGQLLEELTRAGFAWVSIDYRLAPDHRFPAPLDDVRAALDFVRTNARALRLDPDRIALLGEDAGGHLAALLASEQPEGVRALVSLGGVYDLRPSGDGNLAERVEAFLGADPAVPEVGGLVAEASPLDRVAPGMPPTLLVHGGADTLVPLDRVRRYAETLAGAGVDVEVLEVEGAFHDVENWWPVHWGYKQRLVAWLQDQLDLTSPDHEPYADDWLTKDVAFGGFEGEDGTREELLLDAWVPQGAGPFPAVVLAHGGGWEAGDKVTYLTPVFEPLAKAGYAWFSIDYRLTPEHRHVDQLADLRRAIRFVRHDAERLRIDPDRIATLGESASGQMVAQVASEPCDGIADAEDPVDREPCDATAVVSFYGVYDFLPMVRDASPRSLLVRLFGERPLDEAGRELLRRHSPLHTAHAEMPPMLLIHGTDEFLWEQGVDYAARLDELGVDHRLVELDGAGHGMESWEGRPQWQGYKRTLVEWLDQKLR